LVHHFTEALRIGEEVDCLVPQRGRHKLSAGEVVALIASRLASPSPLYDVAVDHDLDVLGSLLERGRPVLNRESPGDDSREPARVGRGERVGGLVVVAAALTVPNPALFPAAP
jgi:hypothetical protein